MKHLLLLLSIAHTSLYGQTVFVKNRTIQAHTFIQQLKRRDVSWIQFHNVTIDKKVVFNDSIYPQISFINCVFNNDVNFSSATFLKPIDIWGKQEFYTSIALRESFLGTVDFSYTKFKDRLQINKIIFSDNVSFSFSKFDSLITINGCIFNKDVEFNAIRVSGYAFFMMNEFQTASFMGSNFQSIVNFNQSVFNRSAKITQVIFKEGADFSFTRFKDGGFISNNIVPDSNEINLSCSVIDGPLFFSFIDTCRNAHANFYLARFTGNLIVPWNGISKNRIALKTEKGILLEKTRSIYTLMRDNYLSLGRYSDADDCYYEWKQLERRQEKNVFKILFNLINYSSCGYGVKPFRTFFFGFIIILLFSAIYPFSWTIENQKKPLGLFSHYKKHYWDSFLISFNVFTRFGNTEIKGDNKWFRIIEIIEGALGWLCLGLFTVTYANQFLR